MSDLITFHHLQAAVNLPPNFDGLDAVWRMAPSQRRAMTPDPHKPPRKSAVLILVYPKIGAGLHLILTKRADSLRGHTGQVSFPGGRQDPTDRDMAHTALRETCEETGICNETITVIGQLNKMWIPPSNYDVFPVVGMMQREPQSIIPNPAEVAEVLHLPLADLVDDRIKETTKMTFRGAVYDVPYYNVDDHIVWGATCLMLSELETRLHYVINKPL